MVNNFVIDQTEEITDYYLSGDKIPIQSLKREFESYILNFSPL